MNRKQQLEYERLQNKISQVNKGVSAAMIGNDVKTALIEQAGKYGELTPGVKNYLKVFKGAAVIGGVATITMKGYEIHDKGYATARDVADIGFATAGVTAVFLASNPFGWVIGGVALGWTVGTMIYDNYNN